MKNIFIFGLFLWLATAVNANDVKFWYEDSNSLRPGGYPDDFKEMFENPESWAEMRSKLSVYLVRGNTLKNLIEELGEDWVVKHFCGLLKKENIPVAIDNIGKNRIPAVKLLQRNGVKISHIALQSVLSKFKKSGMKTKERHAEIKKRIESTVSTLIEVRKKFPKAKIGIIDALPSKSLPYEWPYTEVYNKSKAAGAPLQFIHIDAPYSIITKYIQWEGLRQVKKTISDDLKLEFGIIVTDNIGGRSSNKAFYDQVMLMAEQYPKDIYPDYFIMMSWYPHPKYAVRVAGPEGKYTMSKTALDFFKAISKNNKNTSP